jgi:hypothetical protein
MKRNEEEDMRIMSEEFNCFRDFSLWKRQSKTTGRKVPSL